MQANIMVPKKEVQDYCRRHGIRKLALFGSVLRSDFRPDSDVDVLVEFEPTRKVGLFELYDMEQELATILGVRRVDLNTPACLSQYFRQQVLAEARVEYVEA